MSVEGDDADVRDEDDHDLLTFDESGIRLRKEIERERRDLAGELSPQARAALEARVASLAEALARNDKDAVEYPGLRGFLAYRPAPPEPR